MNRHGNEVMRKLDRRTRKNKIENEVFRKQIDIKPATATVRNPTRVIEMAGVYPENERGKTNEDNI